MTNPIPALLLGRGDHDVKYIIMCEWGAPSLPQEFFREEISCLGLPPSPPFCFNKH